MIRGILNTYLDGFLSLASDKEASRLLLIDESLSAESLLDLLRQWVWLQDLDQASCLKLKLWFQLSYSDLSLMFGVSRREVNQWLRNQRVLLLPTYRPTPNLAEGLSCFMVEQHLSPWLDGELDDLKRARGIHSHLGNCRNCQQRLESYRELQSLILLSRNHEPEIREDEWESSIQKLRSERKKQVSRVFISLAVILAISSLLAWAIFSKPEKMPNVYEIQG
ncbi:MAG: hypothetical protein JWQ35_67 [Bacteriovoracaceae bacterium]|nr:hypothetical protein [Bacteriovoracaceae bacterium]